MVGVAHQIRAGTFGLCFPCELVSQAVKQGLERIRLALASLCKVTQDRREIEARADAC